MTEVRYGAIVCPVAQHDDLSLIINAWNGDPLDGNALQGRLVAAGTAGQPPITHNYSGSWYTPEQLQVIEGASPPAPAGGWPLVDPNTEAELLSEADAITAWAARDVFVRVGSDSVVLPEETRAAMFLAMSLMLFDPGE